MSEYPYLNFTLDNFKDVLADRREILQELNQLSSYEWVNILMSLPRAKEIAGMAFLASHSGNSNLTGQAMEVWEALRSKRAKTLETDLLLWAFFMLLVEPSTRNKVMNAYELIES